jgi:hypothetical protein
MTDILSMNGILITLESLQSRSAADLVVYLGVTPMLPVEVVAQIKRFLERSPGKLGAICLVAPKFREALVASVTACDDFVELKARHGVASHTYLFSRDGGIADIDAIDAERRPRMLRRILTHLVRSRNGVLGASGAVHYAKPSQKHTDQFIRAGNVLVNSVEVEMIAWGCLSHFPDDVGFVYTDTGAINIVVASLRELLEGFRTATRFAVDSFGSYKGLNSFAGAKDGSIWVISATTSGNLAQKIRETQGIQSSQIFSIFSLGARGEPAVCHLDHDAQHNPHGFPSILSYPPDRCALCRAGSTPLWLTDEQFLVSDIAVTPYLPKRTDLTEDALLALRWLVEADVFRVSYQPNHHTDRSDIFLDLEPHAGSLLTRRPTTAETRSETLTRPRRRKMAFAKALAFRWGPIVRRPAATGLAERFRRRIQQSLPAAVDAIVHLDDPASKELALAVATYLSTRGLSPGLVAARDVTTGHLGTRVESLVVVASTVASGTSVIDLSRTLRSVASVKAISYFVLIDRSPTKERADQTQQSVTVTEDGHRYDYHVVVRLSLPDPAAGTGNPWDEETGLLHALLDGCSDEALRTTLEERRDALDRAKAQTHRGLRDELFWPSEDGTALSLSRGFVFLPKDFDESTVTQADAYTIIRCLLHSLRTRRNNDKEPALKQHPLNRKVLDVGVFYRFNDPILQAAVLRAAAQGELDYSYAGTGNQSTSARLLLLRVFKDPTAPAAEFALALAVGRLRITEEDKKLVLSEVAGLQQPLSDLTTAFLQTWSSRP